MCHTTNQPNNLDTITSPPSPPYWHMHIYWVICVRKSPYCIAHKDGMHVQFLSDTEKLVPYRNSVSENYSSRKRIRMQAYVIPMRPFPTGERKSAFRNNRENHDDVKLQKLFTRGIYPFLLSVISDNKERYFHDLRRASFYFKLFIPRCQITRVQIDSFGSYVIPFSEINQLGRCKTNELPRGQLKKGLWTEKQANGHKIK